MDHDNINTLFNELLENIEGDWLLVGGALLHVLGISNRETIDVDLVPIHDVTNKDQLKIMEIAVRNNLPPEVINFSAEYFVKKHPGWENEIILLAQSDTARIFRPTRKLFRILKQQRGTPIDLSDIELYDEHMKE